MSKTCKSLKETGERCRAFAVRDSDYCLWHDPEHADDVAEGRRLGGLHRRRARIISVAYDFEGLATMAQIRRPVEVAMLSVLGLEISLSRARTLGYLAQVAASLQEKGQTEERLAALEAVLGPRLQANNRNDQGRHGRRGGWKRQ
jgi:hypothetical protein